MIIDYCAEMSENNLISEPGSLSRVRNINQSTELRVLYNDNIGNYIEQIADEMDIGVIINSYRVYIIEFADDIVLIAKCLPSVQQLITDTGIKARKMELNGALTKLNFFVILLKFLKLLPVLFPIMKIKNIPKNLVNLMNGF